MRHLWKKILPLFICMLMVVTALPSLVFAEEKDGNIGQLTDFRIENVNIVEGTLGEWVSEADPETDTTYDFYKYNALDSKLLQVTAVYEEETIAGTMDEVCQALSELTGEDVQASFESDQSYENQWTVGNDYTAAATLLGATAEFQVSVVENKISEFIVNPVEIAAETNGEWMTDEEGNEYFSYNLTDLPNLQAVVVYDDEVITGNVAQVSEALAAKIGVKTKIMLIPQQPYSDGWTVGNVYTVTAELLGKTAEFPVIIVDEKEIPQEEEEAAEAAEEVPAEVAEEPADAAEETPQEEEPAETAEEAPQEEEPAETAEEAPQEEAAETAKEDSTKEETVEIKEELPATEALNNADEKLTKFEIADVEIMEGTYGYVSTDSNNNSFYYYDIIWSSLVQVTAVYDGKEITGTFWDVREEIFNMTETYPEYSYEGNEQTAAKPWKAGNSYPIKFTLAGKTAEFKVTITASPLTSFKVGNVELIEGVNGYDAGDYFYYDPLDSSKTQVTVVYDGHEFSGTMSEVRSELYYLTGEWYYPTTVTDQSPEKPWKVGKTYTVKAFLLGREVEFKATIKKNPITSFTISDVELAEKGLYGYETEETNDETGVRNTYFYYNPLNSPDAIVTVVCDGKEYKGTASQVVNQLETVLGEYDWPYISPYQSYETRWTVGNTYKVTAELYGKKAEFKVKIKKHPLTSLKVDNLEIVEGSCGYWEYDWDETTETQNRYFRYYPQNSANIKITAVYDGKTYTGTYQNIRTQIYDETGKEPEFYLNISSDQSYTKQWTVGNKYTATLAATPVGIESKFTVSIVKPKLTSFTVDNLSVIEGTSGSYSYWGDETGIHDLYFQYAPGNCVAHIEYGGEKFSGTMQEVTEFLKKKTGSNYISYSTTSDQSASNPWKAGQTYKASITLLGKTASFQITIKPSGLSAFSIGNINIVERTHGYSYGDDYFTYSFTEMMNVSATANGKKYSGTYYDFLKQIRAVYGETTGIFVTDPQNYSSTSWEAGKSYDVTAYLLGKTCTFKVTIQKGATPTSIKAIKDSVTLYRGYTNVKGNLGVTYSPSNAKQDTNWKVADESILYVNDNSATPSFGLMKAGTTTVTATSKENPKLSAKIKVTVVDKEPPAGTYTITMKAGKMSDPNSFIAPSNLTTNPKSITMKVGEAYYVSINMTSKVCVPYFQYYYKDDFSYVDYTAKI